MNDTNKTDDVTKTDESDKTDNTVQGNQATGFTGVSKLAVNGDRFMDADQFIIADALELAKLDPSHLIIPDERGGVDGAAYSYARNGKLTTDLVQADWDNGRNRGAGYRRIEEMMDLYGAEGSLTIVANSVEESEGTIAHAIATAHSRASRAAAKGIKIRNEVVVYNTSSDEMRLMSQQEVTKIAEETIERNNAERARQRTSSGTGRGESQSSRSTGTSRNQSTDAGQMEDPGF